MGKLNKAIAGFFGGSIPTALAQLIMHWTGIITLEPSALQVVISSILVGLATAITVYLSPANAITPSQVSLAARKGELSRAIAGVQERSDALAIVNAVTSRQVEIGMKAAGVPLDVIPRSNGVKL